MSKPQLEDGYTKISNELLDALARIRIPGEASQVFNVIIRSTYGWNKKEAGISLAEFQGKTGLKKTTVCKALAKLRSLNIITQKGNAFENNIITQKGNASLVTYGLQKNFEDWTPLPKKVTLPKKVMQPSKSLPKKVMQYNKVLKKKERKTCPKFFTSDSDAYKLSELLFNEILKNNPRSRLHACKNGSRESTIQRWAQDIDKLIKKDGQQSLIVGEVIRFTANDDFWGPNVQSGAKLREKWDTLVARSEYKGGTISQMEKFQKNSPEPDILEALDTSGRPLPKSKPRSAEGII